MQRKYFFPTGCTDEHVIKTTLTLTDRWKAEKHWQNWGIEGTTDWQERLLENTWQKSERQTNASKGKGETDRRKRVRIFLALRRSLAFQIQGGRQLNERGQHMWEAKDRLKRKKKLRSALALHCSLVFSLCSHLFLHFRPLQAQCDIRHNALILNSWCMKQSSPKCACVVGGRHIESKEN